MSRELIKTIQELYRPKAEGEQNFVDKHKIEKVKDPAGNGDDVFSASNVKPDDRKESRHGYEPGEDEKVYDEIVLKKNVKEDLDEEYDDRNDTPPSETLKKIKKGISTAFNYRVAKHGTGITRMGYGVSEDVSVGTALKNGILKGYQYNLEKGDGVSLKLTTPKQRLASNSGHTEKDRHSANPNVPRNDIKKLTKEDVEEQIDEISKKTLGSYVKKATKDYNRIANAPEGAVHPKEFMFHHSTMNKRARGINKANEKLTKEDVIDKFIKTHIHEEYTLEEKVLLAIRDLNETNIIKIMDLFESLDERNQKLLYLSLKEENGIDEVLDFILGGSE